MKPIRDPILLVLLGLFAITVCAFLVGTIPYPYGMLVLLAFILARVKYRK